MQLTGDTLLLMEVGGLLLLMSVLGRIANRLGQSAIPLYMTLGLLFGSGSIFPFDASSEFLHTGSEIGVILLLLVLGLEYSPTELMTSLKKNASAGVMDALFNALPGALFGLLMGWGPIGATVLAGVTWVSSSGVIVKVLRDLGRIGNRETPTIVSILVMEDLAMAFYLPILSAIVIGATLAQGLVTVAIAVGLVLFVLIMSYYFGTKLSRVFNAHHPESLLLGVMGVTMLIAGIASAVAVSSAVGAFLVGIALSGQVAENAEKVIEPLRDLFAAIFFLFFGLQTNPADIPMVILPALALAIITMGTKLLTGYIAAARAGIGVPGRWRSGLALMPRGEFSVIIAGVAVTAGVDSTIAPFAATYMLITVISSPVLARITDTAWFKRRMTSYATTPGPASTSTLGNNGGR
jgi:CPA2 family monovalent cation:H+ antiporter-2